MMRQGARVCVVLWRGVAAFTLLVRREQKSAVNYLTKRQ